MSDGTPIIYWQMRRKSLARAVYYSETILLKFERECMVCGICPSLRRAFQKIGQGQTSFYHADVELA